MFQITLGEVTLSMLKAPPSLIVLQITLGKVTLSMLKAPLSLIVLRTECLIALLAYAALGLCTQKS